VLLARLQRKAQRALAVGVHAHAHQAAGQRAFVFVAARHVRRVWAARAHGHAETLHAADGNVRAPFARRGQQGERQRIGGDDKERLLRVRLGGGGAQVVNAAIGAGALRQRGKVFALQQRMPLLARIGQRHLDAQRRGAGADHLDGLRVHVARDDEAVAFGLGHPLGQRHRLGGGGGLVEHRGVGHVHTRQLAHQRLEIEQRLQPPLADLRLIRRVRGVPGRVFQHVAQNHAGRVRAVIALADEVFEQLVFVRDELQLRQRPRLADWRGQAHGARAANGGGNDAVNQLRPRGRAHGRQHELLVGGRDADVAGGEFGSEGGVVRGHGG